MRKTRNAVVIRPGTAMREDGVAVLHERIGVQGNRGHLETALESPLVQGLDVLEDVLERELAGIDDSCAETPEHERVVRVRTMPQSDEQGSEGNNVAVPVCRVPGAVSPNA
jgi:hypothetical protein